LLVAIEEQDTVFLVLAQCIVLEQLHDLAVSRDARMRIIVFVQPLERMGPINVQGFVHRRRWSEGRSKDRRGRGIGRGLFEQEGWRRGQYRALAGKERRRSSIAFLASNRTGRHLWLSRSLRFEHHHLVLGARFWSRRSLNERDFGAVRSKGRVSKLEQ
jgi:hypothetical protein